MESPTLTPDSLSPAPTPGVEPAANGNRAQPSARYRYWQTALAIACVGGALYYLFVATGWTPEDVLRAAGGVVALWGPGAALFYLLLRKEIPSPGARLTLTVIASYALTTLAYFGCAVLGKEPAFYGAQLAIVVGLAVYAIRRRPWATFAPGTLDWTCANWILPALIVGSLLVNVRYQLPYQIAPATG